jgi:glycosyltransferase involved in cell wall biosynthesis
MTTPNNNSSNGPLLSITVLNYNYAQYLPQCLESILSQTMSDFEVILINDCSSDNSRQVIEKYLADPRIRLVDHPSNLGYVGSLIEGCNFSRGKYITVISADDYALQTNSLELACSALESDPDISFCYSAWNEVDDTAAVRHTRRAASRDYIISGPEEFRRLMVSWPVLHSGTIIRRDSYLAVGGYDPKCKFSVDTTMWFALCSIGKIAYIDQPLYAYRVHSSNMSGRTDSLWTVTEELLTGIDAAFCRFPESIFPDRPSLHRRARQHALVAIAQSDVFSGRLKRGWWGYWLAFRHHPVLTLFQPVSATMFLRTLLGDRAFRAAIGIARRSRRRVDQHGVTSSNA